MKIVCKFYPILFLYLAFATGYIRTSDERKLSVLPRFCGRKPTHRIVGGLISQPEIWPWLVSIRTSWGPAFCGGTVISEKFILTAAHCVWPFRRKIMHRFVLIAPGKHERASGSYNDFYKVNDIIIHPNYSVGGRFFNDIALIKITDETNVIPACLPTNLKLPSGRKSKPFIIERLTRSHKSKRDKRVFSVILGLFYNIAQTLNPTKVNSSDKEPTINELLVTSTDNNYEFISDLNLDNLTEALNFSHANYSITTELYGSIKDPSNVSDSETHILPESSLVASFQNTNLTYEEENTEKNNITGNPFSTTNELIPQISVNASKVNKTNNCSDGMQNFEKQCDNDILETQGSMVGISASVINQTLLSTQTNLSEAELTLENEALAIILGWGKTKESGQSSDFLRQAKIFIFDDSVCNKAYGTRFHKKLMICAGTTSGGVDACQGDSGGPLLLQNEKKLWTLAGIVSFGIGCGSKDHPGVYTNVANYYQWIKQTMQDNIETLK